jgi:hypothetical protein
MGADVAVDGGNDGRFDEVEVDVGDVDDRAHQFMGKRFVSGLRLCSQRVM